MDLVLIDTSVWIDFLNKAENHQTALLENSIMHDDICVCYPIIQEVLLGMRTEMGFLKAKKYFLGLKILNANPTLVAVQSAELYRSLRLKGVTVRKSSDCIIAWFAIRFGAKLLQRDRDFGQIAKHTKLALL